MRTEVSSQDLCDALLAPARWGLDQLVRLLDMEPDATAPVPAVAELRGAAVPARSDATPAGGPVTASPAARGLAQDTADPLPDATPRAGYAAGNADRRPATAPIPGAPVAVRADGAAPPIVVTAPPSASPTITLASRSPDHPRPSAVTPAAGAAPVPVQTLAYTPPTDPGWPAAGSQTVLPVPPDAALPPADPVSALAAAAPAQSPVPGGIPLYPRPWQATGRRVAAALEPSLQRAYRLASSAVDADWPTPGGPRLPGAGAAEDALAAAPARLDPPGPSPVATNDPLPVPRSARPPADSASVPSGRPSGWGDAAPGLPAWAGAVWPPAGELGTAPVQNTFNVSVAISQRERLDPAERAGLQEALGDILRAAARRHGLEV
ncbi:hypothetical protein [uncultured Thiodictyon sp.]|uniref:hypothetical protein n=1 Tax=uncultured Thiodictyon sp. TaxID=1846217 RepID=UPI0025DC9AC0|nr:hypothetical protein [uncultured Thiodictyon sp.]